MKLHLRADEIDGQHTKFTVLINDRNCGQLCMFEKEAVRFHDLVILSNIKTESDKYYSSGYWIKKDNTGEEQ